MALIVVVGALVLWVASSAATPTFLPRSAADRVILRNAVSEGDAKALRLIARRGSIGSFWIDLYRDQLEYRLPHLLSVATHCRDDDDAYGATVLGRDGAAACNDFVEDTALWLGDARSYFGALAWRQKHGAAADGYRPAGGGARSGATSRVVELAGSLPAFATQSATSVPTFLKYAEADGRGPRGDRAMQVGGARVSGRRSMRPVIDVVINDHKLHAQVDTGAHLPLVMSASTARLVDAVPLGTAPRRFAVPGKPPVPPGDTTLSLVHRLRVGPLQENNVMAEVVPDGYYGTDRNKMLVIGLPVLARFHDVAFGDSGMTLNAAAVPCARAVPATYAEMMMEGGGRGGLIVFHAEADGRQITASVDTGADALLVAGMALLPAGATGVATGKRAGLSPDETAYRYLAVRVAGLHLRSGRVPVLPAVAFPDVLIGAQVLARLNVRVTFTPKLSMCFTRRSAAGALSVRRATSDDARKRGANGRRSAARVRYPMQMALGWGSSLLEAKDAPTRVPTFNIPMLEGMNLYPGRTFITRYAPPPPAWMHVRMTCVIEHGNMYISGSVTGNFGRPIPGIKEYIGRDNAAVGAFTSNGSGTLGGDIPLPAPPIVAPNVVRTPLPCVVPHVHVGSSSRTPAIADRPSNER